MSNTPNVIEILKIYLIEQKIYIQITKMSDISITVMFLTVSSWYIFHDILYNWWLSMGWWFCWSILVFTEIESH